MRDSVLSDKSMDFAVKVLSLVKALQRKQEFLVSKQLGRCGTSIGANIREAQYAQSRVDFISKLQIALKENNETDYWLELLLRTGEIDEETYVAFSTDCKELKAMLIAAVNTAKKNSTLG